MFNKKTCKNCDAKIKDSYNFCPDCGFQLKPVSENYGMLGKSDKPQKAPQVKMFGGGITGGIMNKLVNKMMTDLAKAQNGQGMPGGLGGISEDDLTKAMKQLLPGVKVSVKKTGPNGQSIPAQQSTKKAETKILPIEFSKENLKAWPELKKKEPKTNLRRIGDSIQYELDVPKVSSIKDVSIVKLEKSLEVKAIAKETGYLKVIPIDMPLKKFSLLNGKLTLELDASM